MLKILFDNIIEEYKEMVFEGFSMLSYLTIFYTLIYYEKDKSMVNNVVIKDDTDVVQKCAIAVSEVLSARGCLASTYIVRSCSDGSSAELPIAMTNKVGCYYPVTYSFSEASYKVIYKTVLRFEEDGNAHLFELNILLNYNGEKIRFILADKVVIQFPTHCYGLCEAIPNMTNNGKMNLVDFNEQIADAVIKAAYDYIAQVKARGK